MILYDPARTRLIVQRIVLIGNTLRPAMLLACMTLIAALLSLAGGIVWPEAWWLFGIAGLAVGYGIGEYLTALLIAALEWMAQMLVAQDELIAAQRRGRE